MRYFTIGVKIIFVCCDLKKKWHGQILSVFFAYFCVNQLFVYIYVLFLKVEDDAFEGLLNLEYLDISDNKVLSLPASALGRLPQLKRLKADYNRIGALSEEILKSVKGLEELSLAYNIIREIPKGTFGDLTNLKILNLFGNQIAMVDQTTFAGAEKNLEYLDLGFNTIKNIETDLYLPALKYLNLAKNNLSDIEGTYIIIKKIIYAWKAKNLCGLSCSKNMSNFEVFL